MVVCHERKLIFDILYFDGLKPDNGALNALNDAFVDDLDFKYFECEYIL